MKLSTRVIPSRVNLIHMLVLALQLQAVCILHFDFAGLPVVEAVLFVGLAVDRDCLELGLGLYLLPLCGREELPKGQVRAAHELDPPHYLELLLDHLVGGVGQFVPPALAALAELEEALQAELHARPEADRDALQRYVSLSRAPSHHLVAPILLAFTVVLDLL